MCFPGPDFPGEEGALRVPEEQTVAHKTEDPRVRESHGVERRILLDPPSEATFGSRGKPKTTSFLSERISTGL